MASAQVLDRFEFANDRYDYTDTDLIEQIKHNTTVELGKLTEETSVYIPYLRKVENSILESLKEEKYIKNDSLQSLLASIVDRIYEENNLEDVKPVILIRSSGYANAGTSLIRVIEVNLGLFAVVDNVDELAFVIAHELVHMLNYHGAARIALYLELRPEDKLINELSRINRGRGPSKDFESAQTAQYKIMNESRKRELEADSIGMQFVRSAGFMPETGVKVLQKLGYQGCKTDRDIMALFARIFTPSYKPKASWFENTSAIHHLKSSHLLIYNRDSLETHPNYDYRLQAINKLVDVDTLEQSFVKPNSMWQEVIWSSYENRTFELMLFYSLVYIDGQGFDPFVSSMLASMFLDLYHAKYDNIPENNVYNYVNFKTVGYSNELKSLNNVLLNMNKEECLMTGFMLLNNAEIFDKGCQEHYYLLFHYANLLGKTTVADKIRSVYFDKFEAGKYRTKDFK